MTDDGVCVTGLDSCVVIIDAVVVGLETVVGLGEHLSSEK